MPTIETDHDNQRLDKYLMECLNISRNQVQKMIDNNLVLVNGKIAKNSYVVKINDKIDYTEYQVSNEVKAQDIPLNIVYEDDDVIVVNKENGMVVHPAIGNYDGTLVNALLFHFKDLSQKDTIRPGIVHRIDADTTGLLMIAKNDKAHELLAKQLRDKTTYRKYNALVWGIINEKSGTIDAPIGRDPYDRKKMAVVADGKKAITHFTVLKRYKNATLIEVQLETGRTHQIRVHMNYIGHPIVNDTVYGKRKVFDDTGQCLHAKELGFNHPITNEHMSFNSELPSCFQNILIRFENE